MKGKCAFDESTSLCDTKYKLVLLGDSGVGKTSIIERFVRNEFDATNNPTVGIDFLSRNLTTRNRTYRLQLWDTAGQEKYKSLVPAYLRDAHAAIIVYEPSRPETLVNVSAWLQLFRDHQTPNAVVILVASKSDLAPDEANGEANGEGEWSSLKDQAQQLAQRQEMHFWQVSAKTGLGVNQLFLHTVQILSMTPKQQSDLEAERVVKKLTTTSHPLCCV